MGDTDDAEWLVESEAFEARLEKWLLDVVVPDKRLGVNYSNPEDKTASDILAAARRRP